MKTRNAILGLATSTLLVASSAFADTIVTGVPTSYFQGGGCFNFVMNGVQYSLPDLGVDGSVSPRGGQGTLDGWKVLLLTVPRGTVTFTKTAPISTEVCESGGFGYKGVGSP